MRPWLKYIVALAVVLAAAPQGWCCGRSAALDAAPASVKVEHGCCHRADVTPPARSSERLPATPNVCRCCPDLNLSPGGVHLEASHAWTPLWLTTALIEPQTLGEAFESFS